MAPSLTESWIADQSKAGNRLAVGGDHYAIAVLDEPNDGMMYVWDSLDGHRLSIPTADRNYQLAKVRPTTPGERARWVKVEGRKGLVHYAPGGSTPAYLETPPASLPDRTQPVALAEGVKDGSRRRKRGKRGRRKVLS